MSLFNKKPLSSDDILGAKDIKIERVEVPEWDGYTFVKGMTGKEHGRYTASILTERGEDKEVNLENMRTCLLAETLCNEDGTLLFSSKDISALGDKSAAALERVFDVAQRLSGLSNEAVEELTEEMEENPLESSASD